MSTRSENENARSTVQRVRRYWARTESAEPWFPWGIFQLAWIVLLFAIGAFLLAPRIEADVRSSVADRLHGTGIGSAAVSANGQNVSIRADASQTNESAVRAIAEAAKCDTWAVQLRCPEVVDIQLETSEVVPAVLISRPHHFVAVSDATGVKLTGEVPNVTEQERILSTAGKYFDIVDHELTITNEVATGNYTNATNGALAAIGQLHQGQATWSGGTLSVSGIADSDGAAASRSHFDSVGSGQILGSFDVSTLNNSAQCDESFEALLAGTSIRFQTSSARISDSEQLLESLAQIAKSCPGQLSIEGHTDNRGSAEMNQALSQTRAESVRTALVALGVAPDRLIPIGYGEERPVADNSSADGRAANRRITIVTKADK